MALYRGSLCAVLARHNSLRVLWRRLVLCCDDVSVRAKRTREGQHPAQRLGPYYCSRRYTQYGASLDAEGDFLSPGFAWGAGHRNREPGQRCSQATLTRYPGSIATWTEGGVLVVPGWQLLSVEGRP